MFPDISHHRDIEITGMTESGESRWSKGLQGDFFFAIVKGDLKFVKESILSQNWELEVLAKSHGADKVNSADLHFQIMVIDDRLSPFNTLEPFGFS